MQENLMQIQPVVDIRLSEHDLLDITAKALQADWVKLHEIPGSNTPETAAQRIVNGVTILFDDVQENLTYVIDKPRMLHGITRWMETCRTVCINNGRLNIDKIDIQNAAKMLHLGVNRVRWSRFKSEES